MAYDRLIYGKDNLERIVGLEVTEDKAEIFVQDPDGSVRVEFHPNYYWILSDKPLSRGWGLLKGNLHYRFFKRFNEREEFARARSMFKSKNPFSIWNEKEALMVKDGLTYYKGMRHDEVTVLSFDIETSGLVKDDSSRIFLISNTLRKNGVTTRKLFAFDEYESEGAMLEAWSTWVRETDPSLMVGHNVMTYDLPYMQHVADKNGVRLDLGRDESPMRFEDYTSRYRKDATQFIEYNKVRIYGREVVDTFFLSLKHDIQRKYESYGLKYIVKKEGLEVEGRQHYDASQIRHKFNDPVEWQKIKRYAMHDADDSLALYDLMIPPYFYMAQTVPKPFQLMMESATGSMVNSIMLRSYLQEGYGVPRGDENGEFQGALSGGYPGVYTNCLKWDVASLYPSVMLHYKIGPGKKDPRNNFLKMLEYFTRERLKNKKLAKETSDSYFKNLQESQKVMVNSAYGFMGAPGLNFNNPQGAAEVTRRGREILEKAVMWATGSELRHGEEVEEEEDDGS